MTFDNLVHSNKYLSSFSKKILLSKKIIKGFPEKYIKKTHEVGSILDKNIINCSPIIKNNNGGKFSILILGGSQGAEIFGDIVPKVVLDIVTNCRINIIQQAVPEQVNEIKNIYNENKIENYVFSFHEDIFELMSKADLAISRCGSSTLGELEYLGIPFIAIPYPFAKDNHQHQNAIHYKKKGYCWLLSQKNLTFDSFFHSNKYLL